MILKVGSRGEEVQKLQEGLNSLGYDCGKPDGIFGERTEDAVEAFQESCDLYGDGVVGPVTRAAYNRKVLQQYMLPAPGQDPTPTPPSRRLKLVRVKCDRMGHKGFTSMTMRSDVAERYNGLRDEVVALGGGITTAGCVRPLNLGGGAAQSATSLHYAAIAFDLSLDSGMNTEKDLFAVERLPDRQWRLWMRVKSETVPVSTVQATLCSTKAGKTTLRTVPITDRFINFTELAAKYGFRPIRGRKSFFKGGSYSGAEWWHLQHEEVLTPGVSTFGGELLRIYDEKTIRARFRGDWDAVKGNVWQRSWF